jgi:D-alanyl-D-alanine carboxypeptidase (penicillin-binding protein 5/6)
MTRAIRFLAVLAALSLLALPAVSWAQAPNGVSGNARHVAVMDGATGLLLYCDECETPMAPASMSKLMTVLLVAEHLAAGDVTLDTRYTVSERAWRQGAVSDGSHMFLELGSQASVRDLLTGVITVSANDACIVLEEGISGSEEAFVLEMNRRAQALGLTSARFRNTTGLPDPEHVISAADLARLARHLINAYPDLYRIYSQASFTYNNRTQQNRNPLLGAFAGADGVKTGHTTASGYGLVGSAALEGVRRIIVFNGTRSMAERRSEAQRLMSAAFHDFAAQRIYTAGEEVGAAEVWLGARESVPLVAQSDINIGGPRSVQAGLTARIVYDGPVHAPIGEGAVIARLVVEGQGFSAQEFPLAAGARVGRANVFARAWTGLVLTLGGSP